MVDDDTKHLVEALISNQVKAEMSTDLISGKGNGLIMPSAASWVRARPDQRLTDLDPSSSTDPTANKQGPRYRENIHSRFV